MKGSLTVQDAQNVLGQRTVGEVVQEMQPDGSDAWGFVRRFSAVMCATSLAIEREREGAIVGVMGAPWRVSMAVRWVRT